MNTLKKEKGRIKGLSLTSSHRNIAFAVSALCLMVTVFCFLYYQRLQETIRDESSNYLQEITHRIGTNIDRMIEDNYAILHTIASTVEMMNVSSFEQIKPILEEQLSHSGYDNILVVDETGTAYNIKTKDFFVSLDSRMRDSILKGEDSMSTTQIVNNQEYIIFSVPLVNAKIENKKIVALAASYDATSFDQVLSMDSFNAQAYSQIVTKSGTVVTRPTNKAAFKTGYNLFNSLLTVKLDEQNSVEKMKKDLVLDETGLFGFEINGEHQYLVYTPIEPEEWYLLTFVPASAINEKSDILLQSTLQICGLILIAFSVLITALVYVFGSNKRKLEQIAYVDPVTGGHTIQRFYELARNTLINNKSKTYALIYTNIEKFKVFNEQLGRDNGNRFLSLFNQTGVQTLKNDELIGRLSADNFCILREYISEEELSNWLSGWFELAQQVVAREKLVGSLPVIQFGIFVLDNVDLPFPIMIDRAKLALKEASFTLESKIHYAYYNDDVRRKLLREKHLEDCMDQALLNKEFQVYLQPKYRVSNEIIGGAEALVRWESPSEGMIFPNEFIPLFEKNGFVVKVDLYVFEEVCRTIQSWMTRNLPVIKISVNCSRVHFRDPDFLKPYQVIADRYQINRSKIEIELTESIILEYSEQLTNIIKSIQNAGFGCSMDDFGSGYSSLNMIQSLPVDTLKLDRIFFHSENLEADRTEAVVQSIVSMAQALSMETVAEGVEIIEQVEMLKRVGCDYIQGYVFARPMKIEAFEKLAFSENKE